MPSPLPVLPWHAAHASAYRSSASFFASAVKGGGGGTRITPLPTWPSPFGSAAGTTVHGFAAKLLT